MTFYWLCPHCNRENYYSGSKTTNVVVTCKGCKAVIKASSHKKPEKKKKNTTNKLPKTTNRLPTEKSNGSVQSLIIALNYAINTIKNKKAVIEKDVNSTWYQYYLSWTKWRKTFQMGLINQ